MTEIIPTVVPKTFDDIVVAKARYGDFASSLHVDATDGVFTQNRTWLPMSGEKLPDAHSIYYEAHLMIQNPLSFGVAFARAGARRIIAHVESFRNAESARETFDMWLKAGAEEVGVAILLETSLDQLTPYISLCDFVHMMTIAKIGSQGQSFDPRAIERVQRLHAKYPHVTISVDGGEKRTNVDDLARAGASRFCVGAALARAKDPAKEYRQFLASAEI